MPNFLGNGRKQEQEIITEKGFCYFPGTMTRCVNVETNGNLICLTYLLEMGDITVKLDSTISIVNLCKARE